MSGRQRCRRRLSKVPTLPFAVHIRNRIPEQRLPHRRRMVRREHRGAVGPITADDKLLLQLVDWNHPQSSALQQPLSGINKSLFSRRTGDHCGHGAVTPPDKEPSE